MNNTKLTPFQESLRIMMDNLCLIQWAIDKPNQHNKIRDFVQMDSNLKNTICFYVLLKVWVFKEELKRLKKLITETDDVKLTKVLWIVEPAIERIMEWEKGLDRVRNQFLAHSHRDGSRRFVPIKEIFEDPAVPNAFAQMLTLGKYVDMVVQWLCNLYPSETKECTNWIFQQGLVKDSKGLRTLGEANIELIETNKKIRERVKTTDLKLGNPLTGEGKRQI